MQMQYHNLLSHILLALSLVGIAYANTGCYPEPTTVKYAYSTGEYAGCKGEVDTVGCQGKCYSKMEPRIYLSRDEAPQGQDLTPFKHRCKCCSIIRKGSKPIDFPVMCADGTNRTVTEDVTFAYMCACTTCPFLPR